MEELGWTYRDEIYQFRKQEEKEKNGGNFKVSYTL